MKAYTEEELFVLPTVDIEIILSKMEVDPNNFQGKNTVEKLRYLVLLNQYDTKKEWYYYFYREDLQMIPNMIEAGFTPIFEYWDARNGRTIPACPPLSSVSFSKGSLHVWSCIDRITHTSYWQTALLIDGYYCNHSRKNNLYEVINDKTK